MRLTNQKEIDMFGKNKEKNNDDVKEDLAEFDTERRQYIRIVKNFVLTYFDKHNPDVKYEITQLKNISLGGMCFVTSKKFEPGTELGIDLRTPYLTDETYLEGLVLESHEKVKDILYETRLEFKKLDAQAEFLLAKLIEFFVNGEEKEGDHAQS